MSNEIAPANGDPIHKRIHELNDGANEYFIWSAGAFTASTIAWGLVVFLEKLPSDARIGIGAVGALALWGSAASFVMWQRTATQAAGLENAMLIAKMQAANQPPDQPSPPPAT
jgi:hypothetical protein